jgi:hypothetical protein
MEATRRPGKNRKMARLPWNNGMVLFCERKLTSKDNRPAVQVGEIEKYK